MVGHKDASQVGLPRLRRPSGPLRGHPADRRRRPCPLPDDIAGVGSRRQPRAAFLAHRSSRHPGRVERIVDHGQHLFARHAGGSGARGAGGRGAPGSRSARVDRVASTIRHAGPAARGRAGVASRTTTAIDAPVPVAPPADRSCAGSTGRRRHRLTIMTPMGGALDWLAVGDVAEERAAASGPGILGGGAGPVAGPSPGPRAAGAAAHAAALGARTALVAKVGSDEAGRRVRDSLERLRVDLRWLRDAPGLRTTIWHQPDGEPQLRRGGGGGDPSARLSEVPPISVAGALTVGSWYCLSVQAARSAALGALAGAATRGGRSALLLEADLLWWTNARMTRRVLEPALTAADSVALTASDAQALFGQVDDREALRLIAEMGPRLIYLTQADGGVLLRDSSRVYACPADEMSRDRYAGPAAFWVGLAQRAAPRKAALDSVRYAHSVRRPGAPRQPHPSPAVGGVTRL